MSAVWLSFDCIDVRPAAGDGLADVCVFENRGPGRRYGPRGRFELELDAAANRIQVGSILQGELHLFSQHLSTKFPRDKP